MTALDTFGFAASLLMLATYAFEARGTWLTLAFSGSCALASAYGFLQGAWPVGITEAVWTVVAFVRWRQRIGGNLAPHG